MDVDVALHYMFLKVCGALMWQKKNTVYCVVSTLKSVLQEPLKWCGGKEGLYYCICGIVAPLRGLSFMLCGI